MRYIKIIIIIVLIVVSAVVRIGCTGRTFHQLNTASIRTFKTEMLNNFINIRTVTFEFANSQLNINYEFSQKTSKDEVLQIFYDTKKLLLSEEFKNEFFKKYFKKYKNHMYYPKVTIYFTINPEQDIRFESAYYIEDNLFDENQKIGGCIVWMITNNAMEEIDLLKEEIE